MQLSKAYLQDKLILLLLSLNFFSLVLISVLVSLRLTSISSESYFVQYRANFGEVAYKTGGLSEILLFIFFAILIVAFHILLSYKTYRLRKQLAVVLLCMSIFLVAIALIVDNALLALR